LRPSSSRYWRRRRSDGDDHEQLRARVRELIASDDLPNEPPIVQNAGPGFGNFKRGSRCLICGEPDAMVGYFWVDGRVAYLHAACDAAWMQERERQEGT
jgi:hypothetical protein